VTVIESDYETFVRAKAVAADEAGMVVSEGDVHPSLLPHQRAIVRWAVAGGRRAVFAAFGLGKTRIQLEVCRLIRAEVGARALIVLPLGVRQEFARDAADLDVDVRFIRRTAELDDDPGWPGIYLTNYESIRDDRLNVGFFDVVSLDEASVLRSLGSKTTNRFRQVCADIPFRFVATATPSPNRFKELLHYADFLGVMDQGQALTRWFRRDPTKAGNLTLHPHKAEEFWLWMSTWSVFLQRPSDLGFSDDGYILPELDLRMHEVAVDHEEHIEHDNYGQGFLYRGSAGLGVVQAAREKRRTLDARVAKMAALVGEAPADEHFILWHSLEDERRAITKAIPDAVEVYGSLDLDVREQRIIDFSDGRVRLLATKPEIFGSGCNFQRHCNRAIYAGVGFDFNDFIQSIHRLQRFQQTRQVRIDVIYAESEREVLATLMAKWEQHRELTATMSELIRTHGLARSAIDAAMTRTVGVDRVEEVGDGWRMVNNDCVVECQAMGTDSVDLVVTSIPFANHYEYTPSLNDFGHTDDNEHFWAQMDFLTPQLLRTLRPGRIYACHVKDRIVFGNMTGDGYSTVSPFHAEAIMHNRRHGFDYLGMITVVTDVVAENNQSYRLSFGTMLRDGSRMGVGSPEYILLFRKPQTDRTVGWADTPVTHAAADYSLARWQIDAHAFWRSDGDRHLTPEQLSAMPANDLLRLFRDRQASEVYDFGEHVAIGEALERKGQLPKTFMLLAPPSAHPDVWSDVNRMQTLNGSQARRNVEQHVCPLQIDIVDRLIERYSNPGEVVFDPFGGLGTVPVRALTLGRRGRAVELNAAYYADACHYLRQTERELAVPTLFDAAGGGE
jgi:DNA methylase